MKGKTCIITGATDGIGLEAAAGLGALGARLVLVGRNPAKGEVVLAALRQRVPGIEVEMHYADLSRRNEIKRLASELLAVTPRIDVLLNNAGAFFAKRVVVEDGIEQTFALNHLGYFRLTALLRERLIASAPSRIVNVASEAHRNATLDFDDLQTAHGYNGWKAYQRSKLANILFTRVLARRLAGTGVTANCLHPGFVRTSFGDNNRGFWGIGIRLGKLFAAVSVPRGAETLVYLASAPEVEGITGKYFDKCREREPNAAARNDADAERLWKESERLA
ncbi:MAG TPA: SDR family NAD(P)-dependent oxidoreductase [Stellaceae bacterium]|nr:SDR family NAD(P)-dependent oxidoreductase [Stellaceae bacterium]